MKFVDKYALVPIERYNQLIKRGYLEDKNISNEKQQGLGKRETLTDKPKQNRQEKESEVNSQTEEIFSHKSAEDNNKGFVINNPTTESLKNETQPILDDGNYGKDDLVEKVTTTKKKTDLLGKVTATKKKTKPLKNKKIKFFPLPPPGVLNNPSKRHIKWVKLF